MNTGAFTVIFLNFLFIGILPVIFFKRDGKFNMMWWLTATPFLLSMFSATASLFGYLAPATGYGTAITSYSAIAAVVFNVASIALMAFTLGTHRIPIALWHQTNDAPKNIVTWGAYGHIRHPFYASFLLYFTGALLYSPQLFTLAALIYGYIILDITAAKEEKKLSTSEYGQEYVDYMGKTGRFFPRLKRS